MRIHDMFERDIDRDINGVIKIDQDDEAVIEQELSEYVVTRELRGHFSTFFDAYERAIDEKRMFVGAGHAGETWSCVVGGQDDVMVDAEGWGTFRTLGGRISVYLPERVANALEHDRELHRIVRETAEDTEELRA